MSSYKKCKVIHTDPRLAGHNISTYDKVCRIRREIWQWCNSDSYIRWSMLIHVDPSLIQTFGSCRNPRPDWSSGLFIYFDPLKMKSILVWRNFFAHPEARRAKFQVKNRCQKTWIIWINPRQMASRRQRSWSKGLDQPWITWIISACKVLTKLD